MKVLLSIKPEFAQKIFNGEKRFEYRKRIFKKKVSSVVVYCTSPVAKIIGEFYINDILSGSPSELWEKTRSFSGITKSCYESYFRQSKKAYALKICKTILYNVPIEPSDIFEQFIPPQSFRYIVDAQQLGALDRCSADVTKRQVAFNR